MQLKRIFYFPLTRHNLSLNPSILLSQAAVRPLFQKRKALSSAYKFLLIYLYYILAIKIYLLVIYHIVNQKVNLGFLEYFERVLSIMSFPLRHIDVPYNTYNGLER